MTVVRYACFENVKVCFLKYTTTLSWATLIVKTWINNFSAVGSLNVISFWELCYHSILGYQKQKLPVSYFQSNLTPIFFYSLLFHFLSSLTNWRTSRTAQQKSTTFNLQIQESISVGITIIHIFLLLKKFQGSSQTYQKWTKLGYSKHIISYSLEYHTIFMKMSLPLYLSRDDGPKPIDLIFIY